MLLLLKFTVYYYFDCIQQYLICNYQFLNCTLEFNWCIIVLTHVRHPQMPNNVLKLQQDHFERHTSATRFFTSFMFDTDDS